MSPARAPAVLVDARRVTLSDGTSVVVRPPREEDRIPLRRLFEELTPMSAYLRFVGPSPDPDRLVDSYLAAPNGVWVAELDGHLVAEVRFSAVPGQPDAADLAVTVEASLRRRGLATALLRVAAADAARAGVSHFVVDVSPANRASVALLRSVGARLRFDTGTLTGRIPVSAAARHSGTFPPRSLRGPMRPRIDHDRPPTGSTAAA